MHRNRRTIGILRRRASSRREQVLRRGPDAMDIGPALNQLPFVDTPTNNAILASHRRNSRYICDDLDTGASLSPSCRSRGPCATTCAGEGFARFARLSGAISPTGGATLRDNQATEFPFRRLGRVAHCGLGGNGGAESPCSFGPTVVRRAALLLPSRHRLTRNCDRDPRPHWPWSRLSSQVDARRGRGTRRSAKAVEARIPDRRLSRRRPRGAAARGSATGGRRTMVPEARCNVRL